MFESISATLQSALRGLGRGGKLTESDVRTAMRDIRQALLEADVNYEVAASFVEHVTERAVGEEVLKSLRPDQQIVGIVHQSLVDLMGPVDHSLHLRRGSLNKLMMCGLQGSGKTTTCGKLARRLKDEGWSPMLVAADLQRPAAIEQLKVIGGQIDVPVYAEDPSSTPLKVCGNALKQAQQQGGIDVIIFDTAGRLHVDDDLMKELENVDRRVQPDQVLLVCDAMTGQDAVNSAKAFNESLELDGVILTKLDGDTRGGAALSVKEVTGVPIKFIGIGEQLDRIEEFHPDRMAGRILGMGDVVTLFEKAQREFDAEEMQAQQDKMLAGKFTLEDFRKQMRQIKRLGPLQEIMKMIPGMSGMMDSAGDVDAEGELQRIESMISSMTPDERENPHKIDRSRRHRIARGSGVEPHEVNGLLKQFDAMAGMFQQVAGMGMRDRMRKMQELTSQMDPSGSMLKEKQRSKRGPVDPTAARERKKKQRKDAKKQRKRNRR